LSLAMDLLESALMSSGSTILSSALLFSPIGRGFIRVYIVCIYVRVLTPIHLQSQLPCDKCERTRK